MDTDIPKPKKELEPRHHKRARIIQDNLLQYMAQIKISDRDKQVVQEYVNGASYKQLAEKYGFAPNRVPQIAFHYIRHCGLFIRRSGPYRDIPKTSQ